MGKIATVHSAPGTYLFGYEQTVVSVKRAEVSEEMYASCLFISKKFYFANFARCCKIEQPEQ